MFTKLAIILLTNITLFLTINVNASEGDHVNLYANSTEFNLDPKLPEPFSRTKGVQVLVNGDYQDVSLLFLISETEGIEITFPIVKDSIDQCQNREIIAAPPAGSTPYYKDFEIRVIDYSKNNCDNLKLPAMTYASLKSYEVRHQATTF